jgi:hypothetical protein
MDEFGDRMRKGLNYDHLARCLVLKVRLRAVELAGRGQRCELSTLAPEHASPLPPSHFRPDSCA